MTEIRHRTFPTPRSARGWGAIGGAAAAVAAGVAVLAAPSGAEQHSVTVTLLGGKTITLSVDVPPGTPLDLIKLPQITTPVIAISPVGATAPTPSPQHEEPAADRAKPTKTKHKHKARAHKEAAPPRLVRLSGKSVRKHKPATAPTPANPTFSLALPGPAPIGVPNFFIDKFRIPPFLLAIYQAAGIQYGVRWEVLAAINEIETDYGRNLRVSSAGARGWMQFMPSSWRRHGVDGNADGVKDPYNPVDAIFSAARYLRDANAEKDLRGALFAYNHADWYVDSVLLRARVLGGLPTDLVGSLTGLTEGQFPVRARAKYARSGRATRIFARPGAAVIAVQDGKIVRIGHTRRLGRFIQLRDAYGNTYTYGHLKRVAREYRAAVPRAQVRKVRLFAHPSRSSAGRRLTLPPGVRLRALRKGSRVTAGTILGRIGLLGAKAAPYAMFEIRPAGRGAPLINPKPILDGWKLLEATAIYRAKGKNPLLGSDPNIGQILLMSKEQLTRRVLADPRIDIYECGRQDIRAGVIDRRVLATLEFLAASGLRPTATALRCGHGYLTKSGNVSEHSFGTAVDIAKINGIPILGHQGQGSVADITVQRLLTLQGVMQPHQIISLMTYTGADNTYAMADHADHVHVGWRPRYGSNTELGRQLAAVLKPRQWIRLIDRLSAIDNPTVLVHPSIQAIKMGKVAHASSRHASE